MFTHRERFHRIFNFEPVDRIPMYYFGTWGETKQRWIREGYEGPYTPTGDHHPLLPGMDPDWEGSLWNVQGLVRLNAIGDCGSGVLEETDDYRIVRDALGKVNMYSKKGSTPPHTLEYPLKPTRESWKNFRRWLDPNLPGRYPADMAERAKELNEKDCVTCFMGGALYNWVRDYMGVEELSYLMYDDPILLEEIVEELTDHFMTLMKPVLQVTKFDFVYFFEDCCGSNGPLFSPAIYRQIYDRYYRKLIGFYKENGVPLALIDSDGWVEPLVPCWLESGFDILFPVEVGKWGAGPAEMRRKFGDRLRMFGGVNKFILKESPDTVRAYLTELKKETDKGGYIPIPDHRIPPEISLKQMQTYVEIFHEVFG